MPTRRIATRIALTLLGVFFALGACVHARKIDRKGWQLVWKEDFKGPALDTSVWSKIPRGTSDWNRHMTDDPACYRLEKGCLTLSGIVDPAVRDSVCYLTGGVWTKGKYTFDPPARIEIRAKIKGAQGAWPALWFGPWPNDSVWLAGGEIDLMEHLNHDATSFQTLHTPWSKFLGHDEPARKVSVPIRKEGFNVYGVDILEDAIVFHVNGIQTLTYPKSTRAAELEKGEYPFFHPWYLLMDMQLGGHWVGRISPATLPAELIIDWVRYYRPKDVAKSPRQ